MNRRAFLVSSFILGVMHATGIKPEPVAYKMTGDVIVYSPSLTDDELAKVNRFINWKYRKMVANAPYIAPYPGLDATH